MDYITIPEGYLEGFKLLIDLPESDIQKLVNAFKSLPTTESPDGYIGTIVSLIKGEDIRVIVESILSTATVLANSEDLVDLSKSFAVSYFQTLGGDKQTNQSRSMKLQERLLAIWTAAYSLRIIAKGISLTSLNSHVFLQCKIISDIRIIFDANLNDEIRSGFIQHQMKLSYTAEKTSKSILLTFDKVDLIRLREQINVALEKDRVIREDYSKSINFVQFGPESYD